MSHAQTFAEQLIEILGFAAEEEPDCYQTFDPVDFGTLREKYLTNDEGVWVSFGNGDEYTIVVKKVKGE